MIHLFLLILDEVPTVNLNRVWCWLDFTSKSHNSIATLFRLSTPSIPVFITTFYEYEISSVGYNCFKLSNRSYSTTAIILCTNGMNWAAWQVKNKARIKNIIFFLFFWFVFLVARRSFNHMKVTIFSVSHYLPNLWVYVSLFYFVWQVAQETEK